jgi:23S rRNA (guanosine2251-2'-O)-methyltransferase
MWVYGAALSPQARPYTTVDFRADAALVIGAEGPGISPLVQRECDVLVEIPLLGRVGSLNASVAGGILLYEAVRQRGEASSPNEE